MKKTFAGIASVILALILFCAPCAAFAASYDYIPKETPIAELDGTTMGVQTAVLYEELLFDRAPNITWQYYTMPNDMILALQSNKIRAYVIEEVGFIVQKQNHPELDTLDEPAGIADYAIAVGNNEHQAKLLAEINEFIAACRDSGRSEEMYDYWIRHFDVDNSTCDLTPGSGENGVVSIAIEGGYEPFSFMRDGEVCGYDVDFMCRFCREYGYKPVFYEVPFDSIAPGTETGKYDFGMNIVVSEERSEGAALSDTYYSCPINVIILGEDEDAMGFFGRLERSFYKTFIKDNRWKMFAQGTGETLLITICSILFGTLLGFAIFMACRHGNPIANALTNAFNWLIHGMPTVLLLMILYYLVFGSSHLSGMWVSVVGFTLMFACSMYDMLHVGVGAIGRGQVEASRALGYSDKQCFFRIILPQAAQHFLPIYKNEVVTLIKETSVVGYIAVLDLTKISDLVRSRTYEAFFPLIATAIVYFIVEILLTTIVKRVQINIDPKKRPQEKILAGIREIE